MLRLAVVLAAMTGAGKILRQNALMPGCIPGSWPSQGKVKLFGSLKG